MLRHLLFPPEALAYGVPYAFLQWAIRCPEPLEPEWTWHMVARDPEAALRFVADHWPLRPLRGPLIAAKLKQDHVLGIAEHYDVSNDFYRLWLDPKYMFYSCADFHSPDDSLQQAQQNKADYILRLIDPKPGEKILELGCGWGSMLRRIEEATGDRQNLYGLTLSAEQEAYNREHNGYNVSLENFITRDYPAEEFDAIYSIGAWEHVRPQEIPPLLEKLYKSLKPGGRLVKHFFGRVNDPLTAKIAVSQIYFPGSLGASYRMHARWFEGAGFRITHSSLHDYRPTLRAWFDGLVAHKDEALEIVDTRTYNRYMTFFPASWRYFHDRIGVVMRWVLQKPA